MKTVRVRAINLKVGDVVGSQRINTPPVLSGNKHTPKGPCHKAASQHVNLLLCHPDGYRLEHVIFRGDDWVVAKRPKYNMENK